MKIFYNNSCSIGFNINISLANKKQFMINKSNIAYYNTYSFCLSVEKYMRKTYKNHTLNCNIEDKFFPPIRIFSIIVQPNKKKLSSLNSKCTNIGVFNDVDYLLYMLLCKVTLRDLKGATK